MLYLSGVPRRDLAAMGVGYLLTVNMGNKPGDLGVMPWGADNGCYSKTAPPFSERRYFDWLREREQWQAFCLFATAPDVVGDAQATWLRSRPVLPKLRRKGWPVALVAQDGLTPQTTHWRAFDVLFIGGTTEWKLGKAARAMCDAAHARGMHVHVGRVNSLRRLLYCRDVLRADSVDGTYLRPAPDYNVRKLRQWVQTVEMQQPLLLEG